MLKGGLDVPPVLRRVIPSVPDPCSRSREDANNTTDPLTECDNQPNPTTRTSNATRSGHRWPTIARYGVPEWQARRSER